ncbi:DUF6443 domain-containing protein [Aquimarina aggregata]|uniref:DUF6443 domain-containing protein n=3 Tax=Aquimarina aggregata TaxID=1642818 RepID=UPI00248F8968|nr:DUF6443 domain-containing protein [Aquimarina aggregata]
MKNKIQNYIVLIIILMSTASAFSQIFGGPGDGDNCNIYSYRDADRDGYGVFSQKICDTDVPDGYSTRYGDRDDNNALITDLPPKYFYFDKDKDSYGNPNNKVYASRRPNGYVTNNSDYNDNNGLITNIAPRNFYRDGDKDGYGNPGIKYYQSAAPNDGHVYVTNGSDCNDGNITIHPNTVWYYDNDGDGYASSTKKQCTSPGSKYKLSVTGTGDCNDNDNTINPNTVWYYDNDGDGWADAGNLSQIRQQCGRPSSKHIRRIGDCNDNSTAINPNTVWYYDNDGDGYASSTKKQCTRPGTKYTSTVLPVTDCNDNNINIHPNTVWYKNSDGDGFASTTKKQCTNPGAGYSLTVRPLGDCNDNNDQIHPNTVWYKNSDGDGFASTTKKQCTNPGAGYSLTVRPLGDCNDSNDQIHPNTIWYKNSDGDGFASTTKKQCTNPGAGYSLTVKPLGDCNDNNDQIHPNTVWYKNSDGDGFASTTKKQCTNPGAGYSLTVKPLGDCNDNNDQIHPNTVWYKNSDGDGFASTTKKQCTNPGAGYSLTVKPLGDCNDNNDQIHPNTVWYKNSDGDGFASTTKKQCTNPGAGYSLIVKPLGDCNDNNDQIHPNTVWYKNSDGDGFASTTKKQCANPRAGYSLIVKPLGDCDDSNDQIHPDTVWYYDNDGDGFASSTTNKCTAPGAKYTRTVLAVTDLDDNNALITNITPQTFYLDSDNDGFGDPNQSVFYSVQPTGYVTNANDQCPDTFGQNNGCADIPYAGVTISNENYVFTRAYQEEMDAATAINFNKDVIESITYFDGLGRPKQQVGIKASPQAKDIVTHITYDQYGRQAQQYLPFERPTSTTTPLGSYAGVNVVNDINTYYKSVYDTDFTVAPDHQNFNAYSESIFEASPLNRVQEQGAPGSAWKANKDVDTDHTIKFDWDTNTLEEVIKFRVQFTGSDTESPTLVKQEFYPVGELQVTSTKDENWTAADGNNHTTREYTDKRGRVVLKRTYNTTPNTSGGSSAAGGGEAHDTYYVYDDFGNLSYILPPLVNVDDGVDSTELSELAYQYRYDYRNREFAKKLPGKDWEYTVFNKLDQPILKQDALLRANNEWLFTKYDAFGREAYTGKITITGKTREQLQTETNAFTGKLWVASGSAVMIGGVTMYYNNDGYPNVQNAEVLSITYYDDYDFLGSEDTYFNNPNNVYGEAVSSRTKSLTTGTKVKALDTSYWITTVNYYDKKARQIYIATDNTYLGIKDIVESKYDFVDKVERSKTTHRKGSNTAIVTEDVFDYDHMGRLLKHTQTIDGQEEILASNTYDELGKLVSKEIGSGLQTVDYSYNVRGWITSINNPDNLGNDLMAFRVRYNNPVHGATANYIQNIAEAEWKVASDNTMRWYAFTHDALYRTTSAISDNGRYDLSLVEYDKMGNITKLQRKGHTNATATNFGMMDNLTYTYYNGGNRLQTVTDAITQSVGFAKRSTTIANNQYSYDLNGNMTKDPNKGITNITYNHFNSPTRIDVTSTEHNGNLQYTYDAAGIKLRRISTDNGNVNTMDYAGNFVYENGALKSINHPEGYIEKEDDGSYTYIYSITDMWQNNRISFADNDGDGKIDFTRNSTDIDGDGDYHEEIRREQHYYPMGYTWQGINSMIRGAKNNLKTYQGQELTEDLGLGVHEWRYRISDPQLGRFWQIDPLAEKYDYNATFAFQENKFGIGTELEGKEVKEWINNAAEGLKRVFVQPVQDAKRRQAEKPSSSTSTGPTKNITGNYFGDALYKLADGDSFKRAFDGDKKAQFRVIAGAMLAMQPGSRAKITTKTTTKTVRNSAQKLADKAQKLSAKNRPNTVAVLETKDGRMVVGRNQGNTQNAQTQADIESVGINEFCGECAEVNAVARAKNKGYDVEGAKISVSNVRGENSTTGVHGTNKAPCSTCSGLLEKNNITVEQ